MASGWLDRESLSHPFVKLRGVKNEPASVRAGRDKHPAVGQQRLCVSIAREGQTARGRPSAGCRIIEFRARESLFPVASCDEHLAAGQQRRRVKKACGAGSPSRQIEKKQAAHGCTSVSPAPSNRDNATTRRESTELIFVMILFACSHLSLRRCNYGNCPWKF